MSDELFEAVKGKKLDVVEQLLNTPNAAALANAAIGDGWTILMEAAHVGDYDIAKTLLDKGAEVNKAKSYGWTALMEAAAEGHAKIVDLLLSPPWKADPNAMLKADWTALTAAALNGHDEVVKLLK